MKRLVAVLSMLIFGTFIFGQNQNLSNGDVFDGEPYLAINPNNSQHIVIAWMGWINLANQFKIKTKASFDGGNTWSSAQSLPHTNNGYTSADPSIAFNSNGEVYISYIDFTGTTPPATGGVYICKSSDGGLNWEVPKEVINTSYDGDKWPIDRPWMVIDKSSGTNEGDIYVTTFNLNRDEPSFNPYLSASSDDGNTFSTRILDTAGWLAGSLNPFPMCSPVVSSSGVFYGIYPSFVLTQSQYFQSFLVSSDDGGLSLNHKHALTQMAPPSVMTYPNAKKGGLLLSDPTDAGHLVVVFLGNDYGDLDVFMAETYDAGDNWSSPIRINDDPIENNRMQDMVWGDFDTDGDLIISWRDRRNGADSTFQSSSEIWASYRMKDSVSFSQNFPITNETVAFDEVLEYSGNDFMCIKFQDDILNASWGDTRNGVLNIWFQRMTIDGIVLSSQQVSPQQEINVEIFPNPTTSRLRILGEEIRSITVYDIGGKIVYTHNNESTFDTLELSLSGLSNGTYLIQVTTSKGVTTEKVIKE